MNSKPYKSSKKTAIFLAPALLTSRPPPEPEQNAQELLQQVEQKLSQLRTSLNQQSQDLPLSIFQNKLSTLEIIVLYLHQQKNYSFAEIARILQRDQRTIWHAYRRALSKKIKINVRPSSDPLSLSSSYTIPVTLFAQRQFSSLEILVSYLRDHYAFSFVEIGKLLLLSPKTVWTVYSRKQKKQKNQHHEH